MSGNEQQAETTGGNHATTTFRPDMTVAGLTTTSPSATLSPTVDGEPAVVLVGNFSVSAGTNPASSTDITVDDLARYVVAPKVDITGSRPDGTTGVIGRYAWWVGDQGTKATVDAASNAIGVTGLTAGQLEALVLQQPTRVGFEATLDNFVPSAEWNKVINYGQFVFGPTNIDAPDVRARFHDYGVASSGLLVNLREGGLRVDLTAIPTAAPAGSGLEAYSDAAGSPTDLLIGDLLVAGSGPNAQSHPDRNGRATALRTTHPFRGIGIGTFQPVVAAVRVNYLLEYNSGFVLTPRPELLIWNPYNADFEWVEAAGDVYRSGYRYRVRISYDEDDNSSRPWNAKASISGYWEDSGPPAPPPLSPMTSVDTIDLRLFGVAPTNADDDLLDPYNSPAQSRPDANKIRADFLSEPHGNLNAANTDGRNWRIRAGDVGLLRGAPMARGGSLGGVASTAIPLPNATAAANTSTGGSYYDSVTSGIVLHFDTDRTDPRTLRIEVFARLIDHDGADVANDGSSNDGPNADSVKEHRIYNEEIELTLADFDPTSPANTTPADQAAWIAAWHQTGTGFFDAPVGIFNITAGSPPTLSVGDFGYVILGFDSTVFDTTFWTDYMQNDPRTNFRPVTLLAAANSELQADTVLGGNFGDLDIDLAAGVGPDDQRFPVLFEVPRVQPVSVGELMHTFPTSGGQSPHLLGLDPNTVPGGIANAVRDLNRDAWDGFFFSTLPGSLVANDLDTYKPANTRLQITRPVGISDPDTLDYLNDLDGDNQAAALRLRGAFNLNSPSAVAWDSVLNNTMGRNLTAVGWDTDVGGDDGFVTASIGMPSNYGRFTHAPGVTWSFRHSELDVESEEGEASLVRNGQRSLTPLDFYGRLLFRGGFPGSLPGAASDPVVGRDGRSVTAEFARILTLDLKRRVIADGANGGPFLSIADFVNSGALQYAIDNVEWTNGATTENGLNWVQHTANDWRDFSAYKNVPSYLSQREMMKALAPVLSARSDTFVIRTYGEAVNPADPSQVEGRAWCEALVQRNADYVDPSDDPEDPTPNAQNERFGRRYRVIAFRWLDANDI